MSSFRDKSPHYRPGIHCVDQASLRLPQSPSLCAPPPAPLGLPSCPPTPSPGAGITGGDYLVESFIFKPDCIWTIETHMHFAHSSIHSGTFTATLETHHGDLLGQGHSTHTQSFLTHPRGHLLYKEFLPTTNLTGFLPTYFPPSSGASGASLQSPGGGDRAGLALLMWQRSSPATAT